MNLIDLKKEYSMLEKKYQLPSFKMVNEAFEIDKIDKNTDCLLRAVRKSMMEKVVNTLGFFEMLLNQTNVPGLYMSFLKSMTMEDKEKIEKLYKALGEVSLQSLDLEVEYSEKGEAELIKRTVSVWNSMKPDFKLILGKIKKPNFNNVKKERSYYG